MAAKSNLALRLISAGIISPPLLWVLFRGPRWGFLSIILAAAVLSSTELFRMVAPESRTIRVAGTAGTLGWLLALTFAGTVAQLFALQLGILISLMLVCMLRPTPVETAGQRIGWLVGAPFYIGAGLAALARLQVLDYGPSWILLAMMLAWFGDTGAYFVGRFFGKHRLLPSVSPSKTVEGSLGGLAFSVLGAFVAATTYLPVLPYGHALALGIVGGAVGQCGDLFESLIKRATGVKDSGTLLPGHGGMLDRIDAFLFTCAVTWLYATLLHPGAGH